MPHNTGHVLNNRYRIVSLLGQGGMGAVYRAWDINLNKPVAIKENLDTSTKAQEQFIREAQILARLSHPHLTRVTDYFFIPDQGQYLVMDYIEGKDLGTMLDKRGIIPESQALGWTYQICDALTYLHNQPSPIIHRDIKPANIKIKPDGKAILVDFGIAKVYDPELSTTVGARAVTPGYSPPEQYGMASTDPQSDIYSLGATLYHLLTGHVPPESVHRVAGSAKLTSARLFNPQISPTVERAIMRATEVTKTRRYQTIREFQTALSVQEPYPSTQYVAPAGAAAQPAYRQQAAHAAVPAPASKGRSPLLYILLGAAAMISVCAILLVILLNSDALHSIGLLNPADTPTPTPTSTSPPTSTLAPTVTPTRTLTPTATQPPTSTPTPGGVYIPSINAWVADLLFFEGDFDSAPDKENRLYADSFSQAESRTIYWELNLEHPAPGYQLAFVFSSVIYDPQGGVYGDFETETHIEPDWTTSWHVSGWGWKEAGNYEPGIYEVELYIDGEIVAIDWFEIYP